MSNKPTIDDFDTYPATGSFKAKVSDDLDIFYYDVDAEGGRYLTRIAIAVDKDGMNLGDLHSVNYPELLSIEDNSGPNAISGFYVIRPIEKEVTFIKGTFNDDLIPYLLKQNLVIPQGWNENYDIKNTIKAIPARPVPSGFGDK